MDEMVGAAGLSSAQRAEVRRLAPRSDAKGLRQLAWHAVILLATGLALGLARGSIWLPLAMLLFGVALVFLFAPLHEAIHRTAFRSRRLNDAVAWLCGAVLILPPDYFRAFHFAHHRHTQDPARDPELSSPKPRGLSGYLWHVSGLPYWREQIGTTLRHACGRVEEPFLAPRLHPRIVREARIVLAVYAGLGAASLASGSAALLVYWLVPALLGQPFLRLYLLAEHTGCPFVADMLENSRTTRTVALVRRIAWNMPYHAEHHAFPAVPFHALPATHALLKDRVAIQADGYVAVNREIILGLRAAG